MIYFISEYKYPNGDAGSLRIHSFAQTLQQLGYKSKIIGYGPIIQGCSYNLGFEYTSLRLKGRCKSYFSLPFRTIQFLLKETKNGPITHIIAENVSALTLILLKSFCRRKNIKLIYDVVEWYSPSQFKYGKFSFNYLQKTLINKHIIDKSISVISISTFLNSYYKNKSIESIRIPIFFKQNANYSFYEKTKLISITYAGQPGNKDFVWLMLKAFSTLENSIRSRLQFNLVGCDKTQIVEMCKNHKINLALIEKNLHIFGRRPHAEVICILKKSHYTILLRDAEERYAKAGFPTKIIESISYGIPPIMNFSSDLGLYFKDGKDCIRIESLAIEDVHDAFKRITSISDEVYDRLSRNAFNLAKKYFDISSNVDSVRNIIE